MSRLILISTWINTGADRHHVEALADTIEEAGQQPAATPAQPLPAEADAADFK